MPPEETASREETASPGWMPVAVGLDVGGTKIAGGVVNLDGEILVQEQVPTPDHGEATAVAVERLVDALRARHPAVAAVGVGAAGLVEWPAGHVRWAPNNAYRDLPLRRRLERATGLPAVVDNDANVAAWAEAHFGAAAGIANVVLITVGTGIGSGLVVDGTLLRGATGIGAELGHVTVLPDGPVCGCGLRGHLEALAAGSALGRYGQEAAAKDPDGLLARLAGGADRVTGQVVTDAAREGDAAACAAFGRLGHWLGIGIANAIVVFDPEVVVIGGGVVEAGDLLLAPARASCEASLYGRAHRRLPPILPARPGPEAGLVGAAVLALHTHVTGPAPARPAGGPRPPA